MNCARHQSDIPLLHPLLHPHPRLRRPLPQHQPPPLPDEQLTLRAGQLDVWLYFKILVVFIALFLKIDLLFRWLSEFSWGCHVFRREKVVSNADGASDEELGTGECQWAGNERDVLVLSHVA